MLNPQWKSEQLAHALCDVLVAKGQLKEKPAFIRTDREAKIGAIFEGIGLDGAKMESFDNPGPLEMLVRKGTNGEAWVQQVVDALVGMLPESAATSKKIMGMDEDTKEELAAAKEKSALRRERLQEEEEPGKGGSKGGVRDSGKGGYRDRGDDEGQRGGWGDNDDSRRDRAYGKEERSGWGGGGGGKRGGGLESMECFNCGGKGHSSRDCPQPRKDKGGKDGKGKRDRGDRGAMQCNNCGEFGHKSRDCPQPVDEERVRQRLAAKAARDAAKGGDPDD